MVRIALAACFSLLIGLAQEKSVDAQDVARLQSGVVKITAKPPQGTTNVGTGFIVRLESNAAYIVTAAHVVSGDTHPKVEFFTKRNMPVTAEVLGLEGDDEVRGLALVVVRGQENLPKGLTALSLAGTARLTGGEDIVVIGFPRNAGPWAIVKGNISSRQGRDIYFSPSVESGHSGGPIFQGGKIVGVVGSGSQSVGRGVTVGSVEDYIEGFGIMPHERTSAASMATESSPPPAATATPEPRPMTQDREITGKDAHTSAPERQAAIPTPAYPETTEALKRMFESMLEAARSGDNDKAQALARHFVIPNYETWFSDTFGATNGAQLAADYKGLMQFPQLWDFNQLLERANKGISVYSVRDPSDPKATGGQKTVLEAMKKPIALYGIHLDGLHLWNFVYVDGSFRVAGKMYRSLRAQWRD